MEYSKDFWRGLSNQSFITNNRPNINAFQFDENPDRKDSFKELSINWNDDPKSLEILLNQRKEKDNQIQFKAGAARIEFTMLKMMISPYLNDGSFSYERSSLTHNQFHGNLLVKTDLSKHERATIQHSLVMLASHNEIVPNPNV